MGVLGSFVRFKVDFSAGSGSLTPAENGQFAETRSANPATPVGYYSQHIFQFQTPGGAWSDRERGMFGVHWINLTGGELDQTWTSTDYSTVEGAIEAMWTALQARIANDCRLIEHRWYGYGVGVTAPNPPSRVTTLATPIGGTATTGYLHQNACTVTLRTGLRRHWGRIYLPVNSSQPASGGQLSSTSVDAIAAAARTGLMVTPAAQGVVPVIYDRNRHIVFGTSSLEVDSVPDIIRRRRPRDTAYRKIYTA